MMSTSEIANVDRTILEQSGNGSPLPSIIAGPDTITCCPTCGQRVIVERDGSYRQIVELQLNSIRYDISRLRRFVFYVADETLLTPKRDWRDVVRRLHKKAAYLRLYGPWPFSPDD